MVLIQVPLLYDYVLINDLGDSIDLLHRQQVTLLSAVAYNFNLIMDFQHFIEIGERVKLEGPQLHAFVEKELDKMRIKEEAAAAREDRAAERVVLKEENERLALKESEERRMQHDNDMAAMHLEGHRARADYLNATARDMNQSRSSLPKSPMLPRFKETDGNIDVYLQWFERYTENEGWSVGCHPIYLSALLEGTALEVYHRLPTADAKYYGIVKAAHLKKYLSLGKIIERNGVQRGPTGCWPRLVTAAAVHGSTFFAAVVQATESDYYVWRRTRIGVLRIGDVLPESVCVDVSANEIVVGVTPGTSAVAATGEFEASIDLSAFEGTADELREMKALFRRHRAVLAWPDDALGCTTAVQYRIWTTDDVPVTMSYRRIPPTQLEEVKTLLQDTIHYGAIAPSISAYASAVVLVRKRTGALRMCCDFRALNATTVKDAYLLPRIDESMDALAGARYFTTLDLQSA